MEKKVFLVFVLAVFSFALVSADIGIGVSPSKLREQVVSGESYEYDLFVFNTGSGVIDVTLSVSEELSDFVTVVENRVTIDPEPLPHELPLKNAESVKIIVNAPKVRSEEIRLGKISITGGGSSESNFGGNVGVSSQLEFIVVPAEGFLAKLSNIHYIVFSLIVFIIVLSLLLRKVGFTISFRKKKKTGKKKIKKK